MGNSSSNGEFGKTTTSDEVAERFGELAAGKYVVVTGTNAMNRFGILHRT
jgi:hypothetical protein